MMSTDPSFPPADNSNLPKVTEFSDQRTEFSEAENSKVGELEAGNSKRGTRKLPFSVDNSARLVEEQSSERD